jgi:phosphohistidine phosphatase
MPDGERRLTEKGRRQAAVVARWLRKRLPQEVRVISSPARRCQQTAKALGADFETVPAISVGASVPELLKAVGWPDAEGTVVVVGHQPTLGRVTALLLAEGSAEWNIKKGAAWWLSSRRRAGKPSVTLRAVIGPDLA